jgi:hypothetical protein
MINKSLPISIRLSIKAYEAYFFLGSKPIDRSKIICEQGEQGLIKLMEKYKRPKLVKYVDQF